MHHNDDTLPDPHPAADSVQPGEELSDQESPLAALQNELAQVKDHMLRAMADAENIRRRAEREKDDISKYAVSNFARELLIVADNLHRGLDMARSEEIASNPALDSIIEGFSLTEKSLLSTFEKAGIRKITPLHEPFDHNFHQAVFEQNDSGHPAGTIIQVLQPGYVIHDRLLRPAMVAVAKD